MNIHVALGGSVATEINPDLDGAGPWIEIGSLVVAARTQTPPQSQVAEQPTDISMVPGAAQPTDITMDSGHSTCSGTNICMLLSDDTTLGHQPEPWPHRGHWPTHGPHWHHGTSGPSRSSNLESGPFLIPGLCPCSDLG